MADREKAEDVFTNLLDEKQHFFRCITTGKQKMRKLEKPFFKTQKHKTNKKINVKHVQEKKNRQQGFFFGERRKNRRKKVQQKFTKIQKIVKKGYR